MAMARGRAACRRDYLHREVVPFAAMVSLQCIGVGLNTLYKLAAIRVKQYRLKMEYDFRKHTGPAYDANPLSFGRHPSAPAPHPAYGQQSSFYPKIDAAGPQSAAAHFRNPPFHHTPSPPSSDIGIRVAIKTEYRITPPPPLLPHLREIPRSNFHFDFEFERNVLTEAVKENPNWGRLGIEYSPPKATEATPPYVRDLFVAVIVPICPAADPVVRKYIAAGLSREAVPLAVANYGDNPTKVKEFANGFTLL